MSGGLHPQHPKQGRGRFGGSEDTARLKPSRGKQEWIKPLNRPLKSLRRAPNYRPQNMSNTRRIGRRKGEKRQALTALLRHQKSRQQAQSHRVPKMPRPTATTTYRKLLVVEREPTNRTEPKEKGERLPNSKNDILFPLGKYGSGDHHQ